MEKIEMYLDEILKILNKDRKLPVSGRNHLNPDIILRDVLKTDSDRFDDFYEIMEILEKDGFIKRLNLNSGISMIDKYRDCLITMQGSLFIEDGGYTQERINETETKTRLIALELRQSRMANRLFWINLTIAIGTSIAALYYLTELYWKYHWFQFSR
jgi:hypothetical protein